MGGTSGADPEGGSCLLTASWRVLPWKGLEQAPLCLSWVISLLLCLYPLVKCPHVSVIGKMQILVDPLQGNWGIICLAYNPEDASYYLP